MPFLLKKNSLAVYAILAIVFAVTTRVPMLYAQVSIEQLPEKTVFNDFVVGPGKIEVDLSPGESRTFDLTIANRLGTDKTFLISEEDFKGSEDPAQTVVLLGDDRGPYSLKDYINPATTSITLAHAERARIAVTISIPADAQPGGLYGSVIVGTATKLGVADATGGTVGSSPIVTRIGTLFFVRVKGPVDTDGKLVQFTLAGGHSVLWGASPMSFDLLYKNTGSVNVDPYGTITVTNLLGSQVGTVDVEPWFAMPSSLRFREVAWSPQFLFGRYVAHASINRGYGSTTDEMDVAFWVIPWKIILAVLLALAALIAIVRWALSKFSIVTKK